MRRGEDEYRAYAYTLDVEEPSRSVEEPSRSVEEPSRSRRRVSRSV
eukprot:gene11643-biopygen9046